MYRAELYLVWVSQQHGWISWNCETLHVLSFNSPFQCSLSYTLVDNPTCDSSEARKCYNLTNALYFPCWYLKLSISFPQSYTAVCTSASTAVANITQIGGMIIGCTAENSASTPTQCEALGQDNFFPDPLYTANRWIFEMINVEPVWKMGISMYFFSEIASLRRVLTSVSLLFLSF